MWENEKKQMTGLFQPEPSDPIVQLETLYWQLEAQLKYSTENENKLMVECLINL